MRLSYLMDTQSLQSHPSAKPYRTKPFPLFDEMAMLVGCSGATGNEAFRAGGSPQPEDTHLHGSPEDMQATVTQDTAPLLVRSQTQMDAHTTAPAFALDPALENEPPSGGISIPDDLDDTVRSI